MNGPNVKYTLIKSDSAFGVSDYLAHVELAYTADLELLADRIVENGCPHSTEEVLEVLERIFPACLSIVLEGGRVDLGGVVEISPSISGVFGSAEASEDLLSHQLELKMTTGPRFRREFRTAAVPQRLRSRQFSPVPLHYMDMGTDDVNAALTPGGQASLHGMRLKFGASRPDEGLFLVSALDLGVTKIVNIQSNRSHQIFFSNPDSLPTGAYYLEVRARGEREEELRVGRLEFILTVE